MSIVAYAGKHNESGKWIPPAAGMGRIKGSKNKVTADIKTMVLEALHGVGGTLYLIEQAEKNPVAFMGLVGKVLPLQVVGSGPNGEVQINIQSISWGGVTSEASAPITITSTDYSQSAQPRSNAQVTAPAALIKQDPLPTDDARARVAPTAQLRKAQRP